MIVFTAHYDHCGTMGDGVIFPGAHDNASGTAAVLDIARIATQKQPYYTIVFMLFSGEELGLRGSKYAAENPLIDFSKVKLLCNIDMFCGGDEGLMVFNANSEQTKPYFEQLKSLNEESHAALELRPRDNSANSDHYWFSNYCPSIFILTMGQPYGGYHDPYDTCEACGLSHYDAFMSMILQLAHIEQ
jgi:Zn-dependent M28 family amino/carboxypeptidase